MVPTRSRNPHPTAQNGPHSINDSLLLIPYFLANVKPSEDANTNLQATFVLFSDYRLTANYDLCLASFILPVFPGLFHSH
jgi:hypothetical protein